MTRVTIKMIGRGMDCYCLALGEIGREKKKQLEKRFFLEEYSSSILQVFDGGRVSRYVRIYEYGVRIATLPELNKKT